MRGPVLSITLAASLLALVPVPAVANGAGGGGGRPGFFHGFHGFHGHGRRSPADFGHGHRRAFAFGFNGFGFQRFSPFFGWNGQVGWYPYGFGWADTTYGGEPEMTAAPMAEPSAISPPPLPPLPRPPYQPPSVEKTPEGVTIVRGPGSLHIAQ